MSTVKVSIVVPIYNAAKYLRGCLDSLMSQSLKSLEIILVNDGSTDDSLDIAKEYAKLDKRFKILNKYNTGYGDSMNKGIKMAKGEYIGIVEPDDFCAISMFEKLLNIAEKNQVDIARGGYYHYSNNETQKTEPIYMKKKKGVINPLQDYGAFYETPAIWSAIYRRDFLEDNKIEFLNTPGASYQDAGFHFKTLACAGRIAYIDEPLYYYRVDNPNSSVKSYKKIMAIVKEYESIEEFISKLKDSKLLMEYCQVAKFGRYHWNLLRLDKNDSKNFAKFMKNTFKEKRKLGLVKKQFFPKKYWVSLRALLLLPTSMYICLLKARKVIK